MNSLQIALRVLRVDRRTRTSAVLTAIGVAVFNPPTMSTLRVWAATGPATKAVRATTRMARRESILRMGGFIATWEWGTASAC